MTNQLKAGATPRRYDEAFRREAVRLWRSSGRAAEHTARELGISVFNLYDWGKQVGRATRAAGSAGLPVGKEELQAENERLRRELARMTEQRDI
ncbi:MAG: transposase, partial [Verrucomicrobiota bacterium]